jgi:hypothetical protein
MPRQVWRATPMIKRCLNCVPGMHGNFVRHDKALWSTSGVSGHNPNLPFLITPVQTTLQKAASCKIRFHFYAGNAATVTTPPVTSRLQPRRGFLSGLKSRGLLVSYSIAFRRCLDSVPRPSID